MIPLAEAQAEVLAACTPTSPAAVPVKDALGRVLAEVVEATEPIPPFANSAMDGYAVVAADVVGASVDSPVRLTVVGTAAAGSPPADPVQPGQALRIMTGAVFPDGADTVAIVETTRTDGDHVWVSAPAAAGDFIRQAGEDIGPGQVVFPVGELLGPGHLGVLSSIGRTTVRVVPGPVVGVLSTGDELVDGSAPLAPGQIRDSNRRTLMALLQRDGYEAVDLGIAADDDAVIEERLRTGAAGCDAVLTSGGVSMGDFDLVKKVLDRIGAMRWMQVAIRPAKPFAFGTVEGTPVFGLPGNPVSSMVSYEVLARPGLRQMAGLVGSDRYRTPVRGVVEGVLRGGHDGRTTFARVVSSWPDGMLRVGSAGGQGSHQLHAMAVADALAIVPPGVDLTDGDTVDVLLLGR